MVGMDKISFNVSYNKKIINLKATTLDLIEFFFHFTFTTYLLEINH
jgi:hypothetical protein